MNNQINKKLIPQIINRAIDAFPNDFKTLASIVRINAEMGEIGTINKDNLFSERKTSFVLINNDNEILSENVVGQINMSVYALINEITEYFSDVKYGDLKFYEIISRIPSTDAHYRSQGDHCLISDPETGINLLLSFYEHPENNQYIIVEFTALWGVRKMT